MIYISESRERCLAPTTKRIGSASSDSVLSEDSVKTFQGLVSRCRKTRRCGIDSVYTKRGSKQWLMVHGY